MKTTRGYAIIMGMILLWSCGDSESDATDPANTAPTGNATSVGGTVLSVTGTLADAFPGALSISSAFVADSSSAALNLADAVGDQEIYQSAEDKAKSLNKIFEAETIDSCFKVATRDFSQPACFAPNLQASAYEASPSSFIIKLGSEVTQLLYGDGGIVTEAEGTTSEACTAATINYFMESAVAVIDQGREVFASLVCASKFLDVELPAVGESKDFLADLSALPVPTGVTFQEAKMALAEVEGIETYTTSVGIKVDEEVMWAYFKHQPGAAGKGHAIAFHSGLSDALQSANALRLNEPSPGGNPAPGGGSPGPANSGSTTTNAVAVQYEQTADGSLKVVLDKITFKGSNHPADYLAADGSGLFDLDALATKDTGNNTGDNIVRAFIAQPSTGGGSGIIGWTASLSDSFWRSFAYSVTVDDDGAETAKSTFGFSPSLDSTGKVVADPAAGMGMFCSWAQNMGGGGAPPINLLVEAAAGDAGDHLTPAGPSGNGYNGVQYQVATRVARTDSFAPVSATSALGFTVGEDDCGSDNTLVDVLADGSTADFSVPTPAKPATIGGVAILKADVTLE